MKDDAFIEKMNSQEKNAWLSFKEVPSQLENTEISVVNYKGGYFVSCILLISLVGILKKINEYNYICKLQNIFVCIFETHHELYFYFTFLSAPDK